jgi:hypothetical protein
MTVAECGSNLSQIRSETLEKAAKDQRETILAADAERKTLTSEAVSNRERATALARALEAMRAEAVKAPPGTTSMCGIPIDVVKAFNKRVTK